MVSRTHFHRLGQRPFSVIVVLILLLMSGLSAACSAFSDPPRLATATALAAQPPTATPTPLRLAAPTPVGADAGSTVPATTPESETAAPNPILQVWVNETSPAHETLLQEMMADFTAETNIDVQLMLVSPMLLPDLVNTAVLSDTLPDVILHPIEYSAGWADRGIFDPAAAAAALETLGRDTFDPEALALVDAGGGPAALPVHGYKQLLLYRADWAAERNLPPPHNYADMLAFAEAVYDLENNLVTGFVIPTESNLVSTQQMFEQIALANGCELIDDQGEVLLLEPACRDAINFYFGIVNRFSPPGVQTEISARNAYLEGRTGMIMGPPTILPQLAGLDDAALPGCADCTANPQYLAENSGVSAQIAGTDPQRAAGLSHLTYLGITPNADRETAVRFADYWFNEGYPAWLALESERKVPMRWGTAAAPRQFIDVWGSQPLTGSSQSLRDIYGDELVTALRDDIAAAPRWGLRQNQADLIARLYEELTFSIVLQEMLSGYFNSSQTIIEAYNRVTGLIPNYAFPVDLEPTATPENDS